MRRQLVTVATAALAAMTPAWQARAQSAPMALAQAPQNVLQLSASGSVEVTQDWVTMTLSATREAVDAATAQAQIKAALEPALAEARKAAAPGQIEVRTGTFSVAPRYGRDGRITAWVGTAELQLAGRDVGRIAQLAGRLPGLTMSAVNFGLSREQRARAEDEAQQIAVERFKTRAAELAKGFGFAAWGLREVAVQSAEQGMPRPWPMTQMRAASASEAPVPVEAGRATVVVNVTGSVQLR